MGAFFSRCNKRKPPPGPKPIHRPKPIPRPPNKGYTKKPAPPTNIKRTVGTPVSDTYEILS